MAVSVHSAMAPNERLRAAVAGCGLSPDEVAARAGIDPKTLERWIAGRVPHPRNRRLLADALGLHAEDLWPETDRIARLVARDLAGVQCVYASRSEFMGAYPPERLFAGATAISVAGLSNNLICQHFADQRLEQMLCLGTTVTCLFLDPAGKAITDREAEEHYESDHLVALTKLNILVLQRLRDRLPPSAQDRLVVGVYDQTIRFNIVIVERVEEKTAVVQAYLPHSRGVDSPTLVMHPTDEPGLFATFQTVYNEIAAGATSC